MQSGGRYLLARDTRTPLFAESVTTPYLHNLVSLPRTPVHIRANIKNPFNSLALKDTRTMIPQHQGCQELTRRKQVK